MKTRSIPPLVGLSEAAKLLGVAKQNLSRMADVPEPLQKRDPERYRVSSGPIWPELEILKLAALRAERKG